MSYAVAMGLTPAPRRPIILSLHDCHSGDGEIAAFLPAGRFLVTFGTL